MNLSSIRPVVRAAAVILLGSSVSGCYELQAAAGQAALMWSREPIGRVISDPRTPGDVRRALLSVTAIREFATRRLDLPDNGSYRSYARLDRRFVVWNVVAAPEFSLSPKRWCYPFVGCLAYRGYFAEREAVRYAARLRARGFDVSVQGVAAYSTLGHFDDPILSSMMGWSDVELASIIFHELTHQKIFVADDTPFDEGLATFVEREGVRRWLTAQGRGADLARYALTRRRYRAVTKLLGGTRTALRRLYARPLPPAAMRAAKRAEFAALRASYHALAAGWGADAPFSAWFGAGLNNADLASVATYERCVPGFARQFARAGRSFPRFFRNVGQIAALRRGARDEAVCGDAGP